MRPPRPAICVWHDAGAIGQRRRFIPSRRVGWISTMTLGTQARFAECTASLASVLGHADRVRPFADYCIGLLSTEGRKSVEPLAAVTAPERTAAQHQSLLHFVAQAPWSDQAMLRRVREAVLPSITRDEPIQVWIIDDTGFPEERSPLGRCGAAVLRSGGQAGQLPSGSEPVGSHPSGKPAGCVPAVSTQGVGRPRRWRMVWRRA